ncbi:MAG: exopolyphosphatase, partial [Lachnospiraceae bacterium]|nr:exopolyphosphatase [Lachnospiraceae bacterium]
IGLSHIEREIVANVVLFNHKDFVYYEEQENASDLDEKSYTTIARLTAILRVANGLDRAHSHKFDNLHLAIKDDLLVIQADAGVDISLEKGMFGQRAAFFEEVIGLLPVIRQKK